VICGKTLDPWKETATLAVPIFGLSEDRLGQEIVKFLQVFP
jgi:hypothetical protein